MSAGSDQRKTKAQLIEELNALRAERESDSAYQQLTILQQIEKALANQSDMQAIYEVVGDKLHEIFQSQVVSISEYDVENGLNIHHYGIEKGQRFNLPPAPLRKAHYRFVREKKTWVINRDFRKELLRYAGEEPEIPQGEEPKAMVYVPLLVDNDARGSISLQSIDEEDAFGENEVRLLETLANSMSVALENVRLFEETQQRNAELAVINSIQHGLGSELEFQGIIDLVGDKLREVLNTENIGIRWYDRNANLVHYLYEFEHGQRFDIEPREPGGISGQVLSSGQTVRVGRDLHKHQQLHGYQNIPGTDESKSMLAVPILHGGQAHGLILLEDYENEDAFSAEDQRLLETLASSMGAALQNARLFEETQQRNAELAIINSVQDALAAELDIQGIYAVVGEKISEIFTEEAVIIVSYSADNLDLVGRYMKEEGVLHPLSAVPMNDFHRALIKKRATLVLNQNTDGTLAEMGAKTIPGTKSALSAVFVPLVSSDRMFGMISLQNVTRENAYQPSDVRLLETLARAMSVALENARLFDETQQRNAELAIINSVQEALAAHLDIDGIYESVGEKIRETFEADTAYILTYDTLNNALAIPYYIERGHRHVALPDFSDPARYLDNSLSGRIIRSRQPLLLGTIAEQDALTAVSVPSPGGEADLNESYMGVPIGFGDHFVGVLSVQNYKQNYYTESDLRVLATLGATMSVALENARLFDETQRRNAELAIINSVQEALAAELALEALIELIGSQVQGIFSADIAYLALLDPRTGMIEFPYSYGQETQPLKLGEGLTSRVIKGGKPVLINQDDAWSQTRDRIGIKAKSYLGVPIALGTEVIGVISVQSTQATNLYGQEEVQLLTTIAASVGAAINNARLYQEIEQRAEEMATLAEIGNDIASTRELDTVLQKIAERAKELMNVGDIALYLIDEPTQMIVPRVVLGNYVDEIMAERIPVGTGITGHVAETGVAEMVNEPTKHPHTVHIPGTPDEEEDPEGMMCAPLISGGKVIGLINVWRRHDLGFFVQQELDFLVSVARQTAIAIESARLYLETERRAEQMATLESVGREISRDLDLHSVLERIGDHALTLLNGKAVVLRLLGDDGILRSVMALGADAESHREYNIPLGEGITGSVAQTGIAEVSNDPLNDPRVTIVPGTDEDDDEAVIFAPLTEGDEVTGILTIWRDKPQFGPFDEGDLSFGVGLARQAAIAITNANLFNEIQQQKEFFETLIASAPIAIVTIDLEGNVSSWSPAAEKLFGYTVDEAIGHNIDALVADHPDVRQEAEDYTRKYLVEVGSISVRGRRTHKDGHLIDVNIGATPVHVDGRQIGYIAIYSDISELEHARRTAEEANQAKSTFLANMSHELRTPLNAIIGFTRIVKRKADGVLPEKQVDNLDKVLVSAEHLLGLINTVLDISKIEAGHMDVHLSSFELKPLIDLVMVTAQPLVRQEQVRLTCDVPDGLPLVTSDLEKIKQVLINLLSNAAKFTHEGEIKVTVREANEHVRVDVSDSGIGISTEALERIFEEFQQADTSTTREYGGTGLGLAISRSLAGLLGGDLTATSEEGRGSTFTFTFPVHYGEATGASVSATISQAKGDASGPLVLVIDDNQDALYLMRENLTAAGYQVATAASGEDGLAMARELQPFAITLDIMMPRKDGWQVLHDLKADAQTKSIPVIMISIVDKKALGYRLGAVDYLVKPLDEEAVLRSLEQVKHISMKNGGHALKQLLVVDDDPNIADMIRQLLEDSPYRVAAAKDGIEALERIRDDRPDAILLDLMMPRLDGFGLLEKLKDEPQWADLPVIVLTAKLLDEREKSELNASVGRVIQKQGLSGEALLAEIASTIKDRL